MKNENERAKLENTLNSVCAFPVTCTIVLDAETNPYGEIFTIKGNGKQTAMCIYDLRNGDIAAACVQQVVEILYGDRDKWRLLEDHKPGKSIFPPFDETNAPDGGWTNPVSIKQTDADNCTLLIQTLFLARWECTKHYFSCGCKCLPPKMFPIDPSIPTHCLGCGRPVVLLKEFNALLEQEL